MKVYYRRVDRTNSEFRAARGARGWGSPPYGWFVEILDGSFAEILQPPSDVEVIDQTDLPPVER